MIIPKILFTRPAESSSVHRRRRPCEEGVEKEGVEEGRVEGEGRDYSRSKAREVLRVNPPTSSGPFGCRIANPSIPFIIPATPPSPPPPPIPLGEVVEVVEVGGVVAFVELLEAVVDFAAVEEDEGGGVAS